MTPAHLLQKAKQELKAMSAKPYQESLWILTEVLQCPAQAIYLKKENIDKSREKLFWDKIYQRKQGRPLEHILREKLFFDKKFYIEEGVFIPRRETETLVRWVLKNIQNTALKAVDFGAGAGTLCLSLLSALPRSQFVAVEISHKSIQCLKKNSQAFKVGDRLKILKKDVSHIAKRDLSSFLGSSPSLIVANPPYVDPKDLSLSRAAYLFDPPLALFSDKAGMGHIVSWLKKAIELLSQKGIYIFELGWNQEERVRAFLSQQTKLRSYKIYKDDGENPRLAVCFKK